MSLHFKGLYNTAQSDTHKYANISDPNIRIVFSNESQP